MFPRPNWLSISLIDAPSFYCFIFLFFHPALTMIGGGLPNALYNHAAVINDRLLLERQFRVVQ
jgi:hypothetical protein